MRFSSTWLLCHHSIVRDCDLVAQIIDSRLSLLIEVRFGKNTGREGGGGNIIPRLLWGDNFLSNKLLMILRVLKTSLLLKKKSSAIPFLRKALPIGNATYAGG